AAAEAARASADRTAAPWPIVLFEAPHRIEACLTDLVEGLGDRRIVVVREMTKLHEEIVRGTASQVRAAFVAGRRRGEFALVIEGRSDDVAPGTGAGVDLRSAYRELLASGISRNEALRRLSRASGARRRDVYRAVSGGGEDGEAPGEACDDGEE